MSLGENWGWVAPWQTLDRGGTTKLQFPEMTQENLSCVLRLSSMCFRLYFEPAISKKNDIEYFRDDIVRKKFFKHIFEANNTYYVYLEKDKILLTVNLNLIASHVPGIIFLQHCVIKRRAQTDCKERRWKPAATRNSTNLQKYLGE